jgi:P27 family predicted phage terminase small subunit
MTGPRGPAPTPTPILKLRGSRLAKGREKQGEPSPERGRPERPSNIVSESRKLWTKLTGLLDDMGVLTKIDGGQLERYCLMFVQWRQLQRVIQRMSGTDDALILSLKRDDTRPILRNAWAESHRLDAALKQIEMQFGLTPAARARLSCLVNGNSDGVNKDDRETFFFSGAG